MLWVGVEVFLLDNGSGDALLKLEVDNLPADMFVLDVRGGVAGYLLALIVSVFDLLTPTM